MKNILLFVLATLALNLNAQKTLDKLFKHYKNEENVLALDLTGDMLTFLLNDETQRNNIKNVRALIFGKGYGLNEEEKEDLLKDLRKSDLEELARLRNSDSNIDVYVYDEGDYIKRMVLYLESDDSEILAELNGSIHYDKLQELDINFAGLDKLTNITKKIKMD